MTSALIQHMPGHPARESARVRACIALLGGESAAVTVQSTNNCNKRLVKTKKILDRS